MMPIYYAATITMPITATAFIAAFAILMLCFRCRHFRHFSAATLMFISNIFSASFDAATLRYAMPDSMLLLRYAMLFFFIITLEMPTLPLIAADAAARVFAGYRYFAAAT